MKPRAKVLYSVLALSFIAVLAIVTGCQPPTPEVVEKVVTQIVKETQIVEVAGTPVIKEVTKEVEKIVEVTPTPEPIGGAMKSVPRNRIMVIGGWEFAPALRGSDNFNPIMNVASLRTNYAKFVFEALYYNNLNTGEEYPWLATGYDVDDDYQGMTIYLRKGVKWADGEPFTCADVKFTMLAQRDTDAAQGQHGYFQNGWKMWSAWMTSRSGLRSLALTPVSISTSWWAGRTIL